MPNAGRRYSDGVIDISENLNTNPHREEFLLGILDLRTKFESRVSKLLGHANDNNLIDPEISEEFKEILFLSRVVDQIDIDGLTKLHNRRRWQQKFELLKNRYIESGNEFSMALIDLDDFKKINDTKGHSTGDYVLKEFSKELKKRFPNSFRLGGEEFAILYKGSSEDLAFLLEDFKKDFSQKNLERRDSDEPIFVNFTAGVLDYSGGSSEDFFNGVDKLLYDGKNDGKNQIVIGLSYDQIDNTLDKVEIEKSVVIKFRSLVSRIVGNLDGKEGITNNDLNIVISEVRGLIDQIESMVHEFEYMDIDDLTKLKNRFQYTRDLKKLVSRFEDKGKTFSYGLIDIDKFKSINDNYGHAGGDIVLKDFSNKISAFFKEKNVDANVYRIGGEEFVILSTLSQKELNILLEEFRIYISTKKIVLKEANDDKNEVSVNITFSAGLSEYKGGSKKKFEERVDELLYFSKNTGRNRIILDNSLKSRVLDINKFITKNFQKLKNKLKFLFK